MIFDLQCKVAVILGGTGKLCGEMAWGLWQSDCQVVSVWRDKKKAERYEKTVESYNNLIYLYPESEYIKGLTDINEDALKYLKN